MTNTRVNKGLKWAKWVICMALYSLCGVLIGLTIFGNFNINSVAASTAGVIAGGILWAVAAFILGFLIGDKPNKKSSG